MKRSVFVLATFVAVVAANQVLAAKSKSEQPNDGPRQPKIYSDQAVKKPKKLNPDGSKCRNAKIGKTSVKNNDAFC